MPSASSAFQYPLFRIELLCMTPAEEQTIPTLFQYPLFRIELLCDLQHDAFCAGGARFNIRSFGSNFSASRLPYITFWPLRFNIRSFGSNFSAPSGCIQRSMVSRFQYPLFRIELLCFGLAWLGWQAIIVSISALSDRTSLHGINVRLRAWCRVSISALSDRTSLRHAIRLFDQRYHVSISALSDRTSLHFSLSHE